MSRASSFFQAVPVDSPVHRAAAETKIVAGIAISIGLVFNPAWGHIAVAALITLSVFKLSNLPRSVLPKPPSLILFALFGAGMGASFSGGDPVVGGIALGGLLDFLRLLAIGVVMLLWTGILSWTTGLTAIGFALRRLLKPLAKLGLPVDEIGTVIALAVRALPLVADEIQLVSESINTRPPNADLAKKPIREAFSYLGDGASAVIIGAHRRARDLGVAMVSRGSTTAPPPSSPPLRGIDWAIIAVAVALGVAAFFLPSVPPLESDLIENEALGIFLLTF